RRSSRSKRRWAAATASASAARSRLRTVAPKVSFIKRPALTGLSFGEKSYIGRKIRYGAARNGGTDFSLSVHNSHDVQTNFCHAITLAALFLLPMNLEGIDE